MSRFPHLFSPISIGSVEIPNRIVSTGHHTYLADGAPSPELIADRRSPREWQDAGGHDMRYMARMKARSILAEHHPRPFSDEIDAELRARYNILLSAKDMGRA